MPNSAACLIELVVSPPALASPMIFALDDCACSRKEEKTELLSGCLTPPSTLPAIGGDDGGGYRAPAHGRRRGPRSGRTRCRRRISPAPCQCRLASM